MSIEEMENMQWLDKSYTVIELTNKDDCKQFCLEDCHCEAAVYSDTQFCRKHKIPLRYGRRSLVSMQVAFIKVAKIKKEMRLECW